MQIRQLLRPRYVGLLLLLHPHLAHLGSSTVVVTSSSKYLVSRSSSLATLELLQVPSTNLHVATVLIETLCEVLGWLLTAAGAVLGVVGLLLTGLLILIVLLGINLFLLGWSCGGATTEPATDGVADGGTDCYTTVSY